MRKFLIVSHGAFAGGIKSALELITGPAPGVVVLQAYVDENKPVEEEIMEILKEDAEWVVFTDLLGGSVTNQVVRAMAEGGAAGGDAAGRSVHIVAGVNLPLVIEVVMADTATPVGEVLAEAIGRAREQLVYVNDLIKDNA
jgi:fructoselysine and glucoselysine-specific PTS system IIA component